MKIYSQFDSKKVLLEVVGETLYGANLYGADLRDADLYGADLRDGIKLIGKRPSLIINAIGGDARPFMSWITDKGLYIQIGCFFGTDQEFMDKLQTECDDEVTKAECLAAIELCRVHYQHWSKEC